MKSVRCVRVLISICACHRRIRLFENATFLDFLEDKDADDVF